MEENCKIQLARWARTFGKDAPIGLCWLRTMDLINLPGENDPEKYSRGFVLWMFYTGMAQDFYEHNPLRVCNSCKGNVDELPLPHCKIPGFHKTNNTLRYNRERWGPRTYHVGPDGLKPQAVVDAIKAGKKRAEERKKRAKRAEKLVPNDPKITANIRKFVPEHNDVPGRIILPRFPILVHKVGEQMINTETLTAAEIAALNEALRRVNVTANDIAQIARETRLSEGTVRRWFDATSGGDYSPAIPADAVGVEDFMLEDNGLSDDDEYPQGPEAYTNDPYLADEEGNESGDATEDVGEDAGIVDPSEASLHLRILMAAALTTEGYSREGSQQYHGDIAYVQLPIFRSYYAANEYLQSVISGRESAFLQKAWNTCRIIPLGNGEFQVEVTYNKIAPGDNT